MSGAKVGEVRGNERGVGYAMGNDERGNKRRRRRESKGRERR